MSYESSQVNSLSHKIKLTPSHQRNKYKMLLTVSETKMKSLSTCPPEEHEKAILYQNPILAPLK